MTTSSHSHPRGAGTGARGKDEAALLQAPAHLTDRDRWLVRLVGEHRVLTTGQLAALGFANLTTARHRLSVLVRLGLLRRFRPHPPTWSAPWHYVLGPLGAALLGVEDRDERKWAPQARADRQRGLERSSRWAT
jgi:Replication-relaxation